MHHKHVEKNDKKEDKKEVKTENKEHEHVHHHRHQKTNSNGAERRHAHAVIEKSPVFFQPHEPDGNRQEININLTVNEDKNDDGGDSTAKCISGLMKCFGM